MCIDTHFGRAENEINRLASKGIKVVRRRTNETECKDPEMEVELPK